MYCLWFITLLQYIPVTILLCATSRIMQCRAQTGKTESAMCCRSQCTDFRRRRVRSNLLRPLLREYELFGWCRGVTHIGDWKIDNRSWPLEHVRTRYTYLCWLRTTSLTAVVLTDFHQIWRKHTIRQGEGQVCQARE